MAGLLLGDDIEDNESESSVESLADDKVLNDASRIIASSQLSHEDDGEDEEFEFFGDNTSESMTNKPWTNRKQAAFNELKDANKKPAKTEQKSTSQTHTLSHSSSADMSTPEKSVVNNSFVHTVEVRLLNRDQTADTAVATAAVTTAASLDEDDEFSLSEAHEQDSNKEAIQKALLSAAKRQSANQVEVFAMHSRNLDDDPTEGVEESEGFQVNIPVDIAVSATARQVLSPESVTLNDLFLPPTPVYSSTYTPGSANIARSQAARSGQAKEASHNKGYLEEAKKAYEDIVTGVYGSGLGDQDVLLLDATTDGRTYTSPNPTIRPGQGAAHSSVFKLSKLTTKETILEGDEEEAEKEEELQEASTAAALAHADPNLDKLGDEWDNLPTKSDSEQSFSPVHISSSSVNSPQPTSQSKSAASLAKMPPSYFTTESPNAHTVLYNTAFQQLCTFDLVQYRPLICVKDDSSSSSSWLSSFSSGNKVLNFINSEQHLEVPFLLAQVDVDLARVEDLHMLQSLYVFFLNETLSGSDLAPPLRQEVLELIQAVPAMGPHWEKIGFQGLDPRTDLNRAMKILSVLQMLHLIEMDPVLARKLFVLSNDNSLLPSAGNSKLKAQDRSWPLMCVGISFTKEAIVALRSGAMNAEANKIRAIMPILHCFHHACFYEFVRLLEKSPNIHHALHLNEIRKTCSSSPLKYYQNYSKKPVDRPVTMTTQPRTPSNPATSSSAAEDGDDDKEIVFDNLESIAETCPDDEEGGTSSKKSGGGILKSIFGSNKKSSKFEVK
eukprot:gene23708-32088_t